jgi:hypothetical protein
MKIVFLLLAGLAVAMAQARPVQFSGSAGIFAEQSFVSGESAPGPNSNFGFRLNPTLSVFGLPLGLDVLVSSQESNLRQALDKFRIYFKPKELLRQMVNEPGFVFSIRGIEVGTCNPNYSNLVLSGVPVLGASVELQPWLLYLAGAGGRSQRAIEGSDSTQPAYSRMLYAAKFGLGRKEGNHGYFTLMHAADAVNSLRRNYVLDTVFGPDTTVDTLELARPKENFVLGFEYNLSLFDDRFRIESEICGSELTRDVRAPELEIKAAPKWATNILRPRLTSAFDYSYAVKPVLDVFGTKLYGSLKMVGPGYQSLGSPSLRNDVFGFGAGLSRSFASDAVTVAASWTGEHDNLIGMKLHTTRFDSYSVDLGLHFDRVPSLALGYAPYTERSDSSNRRTDIVTASTGYSFTAGTISHTPGVSLSWQKLNSSDETENYVATDLMLSHGLGFEFPLSVSASLCWSRTAYPDSAETTVSAGVAPAYTFFGKWSNALSLDGTFGRRETRYDLRLSSSVPIGRIADASAGVDYGIYRGDRPYTDLRLSAELSKSW